MYVTWDPADLWWWFGGKRPTWHCGRCGKTACSCWEVKKEKVTK
jgi:hypothetical protein